MSETNVTPIEERKKIYSHMTRTRFLQVEDSLEIGKIRLFAGQYEKGKGMSVNAYHFMDVEDARVVLSDLAWGKPVTYEEFKGTVNGQAISRVLKVKSGEGKTWVELKNGPGKRTETGAVMPAGEPTSTVSVLLDGHAARRMAMAVLAYVQASEVADAIWSSTQLVEEASQ